MHTEIKVVTIALFITAWLASIAVPAPDSLSVKPFERYWTQPKLVPKVGLGVQETAFVEFGVQLHKIYIHPLSLASAGPYLTVDAIVKDDNLVLGPKIGYEVTAGLIGIAADITYYSDFDREALVFTPRAGISLLGFANLFYGRNLPLSEYQFAEVDKNRFSLVFNLNTDYFNLRNAPRKK